MADTGISAPIPAAALPRQLAHSAGAPSTHHLVNFVVSGLMGIVELGWPFASQTRCFHCKLGDRHQNVAQDG